MSEIPSIPANTFPKDVEELLDEAAANPALAIVFTKDSVQLADGNIVLKEVKWDGVNDFARTFLGNVLSHTLENEPPAPQVITRESTIYHD